MAFSIKKYNKGGKFNLNTANLPYVKLKELYENDEKTGEETVYAIGAVYMNKKSKFGENPVVTIMNMDENGEVKPVSMCNLPRHLTDDCMAMLDDDEAVDAIKSVKVGFHIRKYHSKVYNTDAFTVEWTDLE